MSDRSQQLLDDPSVFITSSSEGRTRKGTPTVDAKGKRKLDLANSSSSLSLKRKRKVIDRERERDVVNIRPSSAVNNKVGCVLFWQFLSTHEGRFQMKKSKHVPGQDLTPASYNKHAAPSPPHRSTQLPQPPRPHATNDDMHFFDRVKRVLDNRETYNEFLKVVNLFTQGYIDTARLVKESRNFLGEGELMKQFRDILGWSEMKEREHFLAERHSPDGWTRPIIAGLRKRPGRADMKVQYGSYRKLPNSVGLLLLISVAQTLTFFRRSI